MHCPECNRYIEVYRLERLLAPWFAKKCKICGCSYKSKAPSILEIVFVVLVAILFILSLDRQVGITGLFLGLFIGLTINILSTLEKKSTKATDDIES